MTTKVALKGAEFYAFHGYYKEEQKAGNVFIINAEVVISDFDSTDDDIGDTVNYENLYAICKEEMNHPQKLLETVVLKIINQIKSQFSYVQSGEVSLEKIQPQMGGKIEKAVITMLF